MNITKQVITEQDEWDIISTEEPTEHNTGTKHCALCSQFESYLLFLISEEMWKSYKVIDKNQWIDLDTDPL